VKTTVLGGLLFLLPLVLVWKLLREVFGYASKLVAPLARFAPAENLIGFAVVDVLAVVILVLVAFLAGLAARTASGKRITERIEQLFLRKMPGYTLIKSMTQDKVQAGARFLRHESGARQH